MARTQSPPVNSVTQGAVIFKFACIDPATEVWFFTSTAALTDGTSGDGAGWAGPGSVCVRTDTAKLYVNGGSKASPAWKLVTSAA